MYMLNNKRIYRYKHSWYALSELTDASMGYLYFFSKIRSYKTEDGEGSI